MVHGRALAHFGAVTMDTNLVSAVPEPETYAMLLAGLGLLGFMARRRKESAV
ncbi:MAG: FxDxF family PEP-CTERM protein [Coxiellaceae bacterium]|nr:FxDxF family PEP-CTERM protein [Coxiellaceae bacterium]